MQKPAKSFQIKYIMELIVFIVLLEAIVPARKRTKYEPRVSGKNSFKIVLGIFQFIALNFNAHWEFINTEK